VQVEAPALEDVPELQVEQLLDPELAEYVPAEQLVHEDAPAAE